MVPISEQPIVEISALYSFYHFHFAAGYVFPGERHPFWEMVCVLNGQVDIGADDAVYMLSAGDVIFHRPDEFHSIWANYAHAPDLLVVSFECSSPAMRAFERRQLRATPAQRALMEDMIREAERTFTASLQSNDGAVRPDRAGGAYTLRLVLTRMLMDMLDSTDAHSAPVGRSRQHGPDEEKLIQSVLDLMRANLCGGLCFTDLCRRMGMSATAVKQLFRRRFETTPMAYYEQLRMSEARRQLREEGKSIAAVADDLGFSSPAYFSTRFRHVNGVSPRQFLSGLQP